MTAAPKSTDLTAAQLRAYAATKDGLTVGARGRISATVRTSFDAEPANVRKAYTAG